MFRIYCFALLFLCLNNVNAQEISPKIIQEKLEDIDSRSTSLFRKIEKPLYSSYSLQSKYAGYFRTASSILAELDELEKGAGKIAMEYSSDRDFYIRLASIHLSQLKIRNNKEMLLSHLKFSSTPTAFEDTMAVWDRKLTTHLKDLRKSTEKLRQIDAKSPYADFFESVALFYEGNRSAALEKITELLREIESSSKNSPRQDEMDQLSGFCTSWKAFFEFSAGKSKDFTQTLLDVVASKGPASSISWAAETKRSYDKSQFEGADLYIRKFVPENNSVNRDFLDPDFVFDSKFRIASFTLREASAKEFPTPENAVEQLRSLYERYSKWEQSRWDYLNQRFYKDAKNAKALYSDGKTLMYRIQTDSKAKITTKPLNISYYLAQMTELNALVKQATINRAVWNTLLKNNPDIPFFRIYRIKADLLLYRLTERNTEFAKAFEYMKYANKKAQRPSGSQSSEFRDQIKADYTGEIRTDIQYLEKLIGDGPLLMLSRLEIAQILEAAEGAKGQVPSMRQKISPEMMIENQKPEMYLKAAELVSDFNGGRFDSKEFRELLNELSDYEYASGLVNTLRSRTAFLKELRETIGKMKKKPTLQAYLPDFAMPLMSFPKEIRCSYVSEPPIYIPSSIRQTLEGVASQYFRLAILPALDMTNRAESYRNSITDMFYTSIFETRRFSLMDRMEVTRVQDKLSQSLQEKLIDRMGTQPTTADTAKATETNSGVVSKKEEMDLLNKLFQKNDASQQEYKTIASQLRNNAEGVLLLYITNDLKSVDGYGGKVGIDYRIISTQTNDVLFAGHKDIGYNFDRKTETLLFNRDDVNAVADEIKMKFPNPDLQENLKIVARRGNRIIVNAGKNQNITAGLEGFVLKLDGDLSGSQVIRYRAEFIVKDVFSDTFSAELIADKEPKQLRSEINATIETGEPVKMK